MSETPITVGHLKALLDGVADHYLIHFEDGVENVFEISKSSLDPLWGFVDFSLKQVWDGPRHTSIVE